MMERPLKEQSVPCKPCNGTGSIACGDDVECIRCNGKGWVKPSEVVGFDAIMNAKARPA